MNGKNNRKTTFSILGRIGGDATLAVEDRGAPLDDHFQYPRSDRRRCNSAVVGVCRRGMHLSVSSVGSEAMQPTLNC